MFKTTIDAIKGMSVIIVSKINSQLRKNSKSTIVIRVESSIKLGI